MEPGDKTREHLEMVAAKAGNYTLVGVVVVVVVVDAIDSWVARIDCLCSVFFHHSYLILPQCHLGVVVSQTAHWLEPYWLSSAEIHLPTSYVTARGYESNIQFYWWFRMKQSIVEILKVAVTFGGMKTLYMHPSCHKLWCFTSPLIPWNPAEEQKS